MASPSTPNGIFSNPAVNSVVDEDLWGGITNSNWNIADADTTTRRYDLNFADFTLSRGVFKDYSETVNAAGNISGAVVIDYSLGNHYDATLTGNVSGVTITNGPPTGKLGILTMRLAQDGTGGWVFPFPSLIKWSGNVTPVFPSTASESALYALITYNSFSTAGGIISGQNFVGW